MTQLLLALGSLALGAVLAMALVRLPRAALAAALTGAGVGGLLCCAAALAGLLPGPSPVRASLAWPLPLGEVALSVDGLSAWFLLAIGMLAVAVAIYAWGYFQPALKHEPIWAAVALMNVLIASMIVTVCAADAVTFLFGWELMSLTAFLLVGFQHRDERTRRAAWVYLVATHLGTAFGVVPLLSALAARSGGTSFAGFDTAFGPSETGACVALFLLGVVGFGVKAGFVPMHVWLPLAHPAAATPVSALLSGVVIKTGIYGLLRLLSWLPELPTGCAVAMLLLGAVSGVAGVLYALAQHDLKRLLAYHSVENIGIIGLGIGMGMLGQAAGQPAWVALGYAGALLHVLNHALFKGLLFLGAGQVIQATGTGAIERLGGLARHMPLGATLFLVGALAICGLPPLNGFVSEWLLYGAMFGGALRSAPGAAGAAAVGVVSLALMGGLALACFAKVFGVVFLGLARDDSIRPRATPPAMIVGMALPAALCVAIGLAPALVVPLTAGGVGAIAGLQPAAGAEAARTILAPVGVLSGSAAVLLAAVGGLALLRRALLRRNPRAVVDVDTWGCGYARPSARMQYTGSSFAWPLIHSFRHLLWPHRSAVEPVGSFAPPLRLESHVPDLAEQDIFAPLFRGLGRCFQAVRTLTWAGRAGAEAPPVPADERIGPLRALRTSVLRGLRRGSVHVYLALIVLTLLTVFLVEAVATAGQKTTPRPPEAGAVEGSTR